MKQIFRLLYTTLIFIFVLVSCSNGNETTTNSNVSKRLMLNITDATNLYIGKSSLTSNRAVSSRESNNNVNKLFKITESGYVQEITYSYEVVEKDDEGNILKTSTETAIESFVPETINNLNNNYLLVCFTQDKYLVNISTGACYEWPSSISIYDMATYAGAFGGDYTYSDSNGNIYTVAHNSSNYGVYKLDISDLENISMSLYSSKSDTSISMYAVDKYGNLGYFGRDSSNSDVYRLRKANGGYENIPSRDYNIMFFLDFDGNMYYQSGFANHTITKVSVDNGTAVFTNYPGDNDYDIYGQKSGFLKIKNKKIILGINDLNNAICVVYDENSNQAYTYSGTEIGMNSMKYGIASDDFYYVVGINSINKNVIQKVNPLTKEYSSILTGFDVYKMSVSDDETINFNALRMNDGAIVIGTIDNEENLKILDESLQEEISVLTRIK